MILFPISALAVSGTSTFSVDVEINNCNNNNVCENLIDESFLTCENDCPAVCVVNGVCEAAIGETTVNCSQDCVVTPTTTTSTIPVVNVTSGGGGGGVLPQNTVLNVINLLAKSGDSNVLLSWEILDNVNYGGVLIKRSDDFSVSTISGGGVLYKGKGDFVKDSQYSLSDINLINGHWYFYTVYLFDNNGNFASGASVYALPQSDEMKDDLLDLIIPPKKLPPELSLPKTTFTTTSKATKIQIIQKESIIKFEKNSTTSFVLEPNVTTTIFIRKQDLPEGTRAITATIESAEGFQTLLLKREISGDYQLVIPAVSLSNGGMVFTFLGEKNLVLDRVSGTIEVTKHKVPESEEKSVIMSKITQSKSIVSIFFKPICRFIVDLNILIFDIVVRILKLLKYWINILGVLVIHK